MALPFSDKDARMRRFVLYLLTCLSLLQAPTVFAEEPCPEFNNNIYMKWVDLDASCISISDFAKKIEAEGIWEIEYYVESDAAITLSRRDQPDMTAEVKFGGLLGTVGSALLKVTMNQTCRSAFSGLEKIGYPEFPDDYKEAGDIYHVYFPFKIGNTIFTIISADDSNICIGLQLLTI